MASPRAAASLERRGRRDAGQARRSALDLLDAARRLRPAPLGALARRGRWPRGGGDGLLAHAAAARIHRAQSRAVSRERGAGGTAAGPGLCAPRGRPQRGGMARDDLAVQHHRRGHDAGVVHGGRGGGAARAAHGGHRAAVLARGGGAGLGARTWPPLADQCARRSDRAPRRQGPQRRGHHRARRCGEGDDHPRAPHAYRLAGRPPTGGSGAAGDRADARGRPCRSRRAPRRLCLRGGPGLGVLATRPLGDREPDLSRGHPARVDIRRAGADLPRAGPTARSTCPS
jgi:hypothetical protein